MTNKFLPSSLYILYGQYVYALSHVCKLSDAQRIVQVSYVSVMPSVSQQSFQTQNTQSVFYVKIILYRILYIIV